MKVLLHIGIMFLYLWVSIGVTVATHYCAGEPFSSNMLDGAVADLTCCCGAQEMMENCCSTSITTLHLDDVHTLASASFSVSFHNEQIPVLADPLFLRTPAAFTATLERPPGTGNPTHLLHCVLLI